MKTIKLILIFCALLNMASLTAIGQVKLPSFISNGMVLQRDVEIPVWGWAASGEKVQIDFMGKSYTTVTGTDRKWKIKLKPQKAGGPFEMKISASNSIAIKDILIGDVWLCSGQSNMEFEMAKVSEKYKNEIAASENNQIRQFLVKRRIAFNPFNDVETEVAWQSANPTSVLNFTAVGYFFAKNPYEKYKVPIGLINCSYGGTPAEAWVNEDVLKNYPSILTKTMEYKDSTVVNAISKKDKDFTKNWYKTINKNDLGSSEKWYLPDYNSNDWKTMKIPGFWQQNGIESSDAAVVWFRKEIEIPANLAGKQAILTLGNIILRDTTYFNGVKVGNTSNKYLIRKYIIDGKLIKAGKNSIALRILNENGDGGFIKDKVYKMEIDGQEFDLKGDWQFKLSATSKPLLRTDVTRFQDMGASMFYGMLSPLIGYGIKGVIWYQGESNTSRAKEYQTLFPELIQSWRTLWNQGVFPFLFVQIANINEPKTKPSDSKLAELQEAQSMALVLPFTGMAVTNDIGEWNDVHPLNKADVGYRLAIQAYKIAYGEKNAVNSGPTFQSMKIDGDKIILTFTNIGSGLMAKGGGDLNHFAIADSSKKFVWANATIDGNKVIVKSDKIKTPVAVRYAWADNPVGANLYNKEGLPASCFRTDNWGKLNSKKTD